MNVNFVITYKINKSVRSLEKILLPPTGKIRL